MTSKELRRVKNYLKARGIARAWHYCVVALTMGNVERAVEQYDRETTESPVAAWIVDPNRCGWISGQTGKLVHNSKASPVLKVDERRETEDIDLLTTVILSQPDVGYSTVGYSTVDYSTEPVPTQNDDGDFGGGGSGGGWSDYETSDGGSSDGGSGGD